MNLKTWYDSGSATVLSGSTTVSGTGALWGTGGTDDNIMVGDLFSVPSQPMVPAIPVKSVSAGGELELLWPWPGTDVTAQPYIIRYVGIIERSTRANRMALERMGEISAWYDLIVETDADRVALETAGSPLRAGYRVLVKADGVIWAKETSTYGDWIGPVEFKGDTGEKGDTGDRGPTGRGPTPKGTYNPATAYVLDDAVLDNGSSWIALGSTTGNAPPVLPATSNAHWQLLARKGTDGEIEGVTPFWVTRLGSDADAAAARAGLGALADQMPAARFKGRVAAGAGAVEDLTAAQVRSELSQVWEKIGNTINAPVGTTEVGFGGLGDFRLLMLKMSIVPSAMSGGGGIRTSRNEGATWDAGATDYFYQGERLADGVRTLVTPGSLNLFPLTAIGLAGNMCKATIEFDAFNKASLATITQAADFWNANDKHEHCEISGYVGVNGMRNALQFKAVTGSFSGWFELWGARG